jgi:ssRNA-specific RNase YbeY (16S rRNA maturation enzyme)
VCEPVESEVTPFRQERGEAFGAVRAKDADTARRLRRWVRATERGRGRGHRALRRRGRGATLNRDYRGKDYATNVLSFPYDAGSPC